MSGSRDANYAVTLSRGRSSTWQEWTYGVASRAGSGGMLHPRVDMIRPPVLGLMTLVSALGCSQAAPVRGPMKGMIDPGTAAACLLLKSCPTSPGFALYSSISNCLWSNAQRLPDPEAPSPGRSIRTSAFTWAAVDCLGASANCLEVSRCVTSSAELCARWADAGLPPAQCEGNLLVGCSSRVVVDCSVVGETCIAPEGRTPGCGDFSCSQPIKTCDGNVASVCDEAGIGREDDCARWGERCLMIEGQPRCVGAGPSCTRDRCDGDDLIHCDEGFERRVPCASMPRPETCRADQDGVAACRLPSRAACDPSTHQDRCDEAALVFCDGEEQRLNCLSFGFSACIDDDDAGARCL